MKNRKAIVLFNNEEAGIIEELNNGYRFIYNKEFLKKQIPISFSLPLTEKPYENPKLFPFFLGLLPEGWYLELVCAKLKIDRNDHFGLLLATCKETIGAVTIKEMLKV